MKITNNQGLPQPFVDAVSSSIRVPKRGIISCTGIIDPPQKRVLTIDNWEEIVIDASEMVWSLFGLSTHAILQKYADGNHLSEETLSHEIDGWNVTGTPDLLENEVLDDYKVTSVYAFLLGEKEEWKWQDNIYAWLFRKYGFRVARARIVAILRDWSKRKAEFDKDYPQSNVLVKEIELLSDEEVESYVRTRLIMHKMAEDGALPLCSDEERWHRPDKWAVKKEGNIKATRVFDREYQAEVFIIDQEKSPPKGKKIKWVIEHRKGEDVRCDSYCSASPWCEQRRQS